VILSVQYLNRITVAVDETQGEKFEWEASVGELMREEKGKDGKKKEEGGVFFNMQQKQKKGCENLYLPSTTCDCIGYEKRGAEGGGDATKVEEGSGRKREGGRG
jgi:hypothetical protein